MPEVELPELLDELEVSPGAEKLVEESELEEAEEFEELPPGEETPVEEPEGPSLEELELLEEVLESCAASVSK